MRLLKRLSCLHRQQFQVPCSNVLCKPLSTEADVLDLFDLKDANRYGNKVLESPKQHETPQIEQKKGPPIIECKRSEFNHYRNQKYDHLAPIPLASKGWNHYKSKGDYFKIQIYNEDKNKDELYWDDSNKSFSDLNLESAVVDAVNSLGIYNPTFIQELSIPTILSGRNALITAETGCGKTLAYLLPIVQQLVEWNREGKSRPPNTPLAMILCPNRELVFQIGEIAKKLSYQLPFRCEMLVGGRTKKKMLNPDFKNVDLQITTIGVISKLTTMGLFDVKEVRHLVLDEADTMLDDSFNDLLLRFMKKFQIMYTKEGATGAKGCQLTLASATKPTSLYTILQEFIETDSLVKLTSPRLHRVMPHVPQIFYRLGPSDKSGKILHLARAALRDNKPTIIFSNKSSTSDWISLLLGENHIPSINLNGNMPVVIRSGKFRDFQEQKIKILSCTDIASRGLDTKHVKQVINFDFPLYMADYIHRCGRTGRCGSPQDCSVINFVSGEREVEIVNKIEMAVRTMDVLPNVNANITKIIHHKIIKRTY
ncbi:probable ATP-dependent RNA helicase DDX28 isoform X2 [Cimex lectularius]|uniref:RNA helicase n=1 Tax=Cimex lectularius TaxID=79782 RepID=A0A8I6S6R9_CIMLE|nr:probable ATP-dependent RNA helicase DDX28 isoform X2 [Cimex lectularius]